ncbi:TIGR03749 family integrating conjugative element protein [Comamonadaceae bacterium OH2545_COT-014]|nr:TIGR03749 family integrating conjugative element protein [Comamonadaceae bacterium OH2545_COT-014]
MSRAARRALAGCALAAPMLLLALPASAQDVTPVSLDSVPPDLIQVDAPSADAAQAMQPVDLGQEIGASASSSSGPPAGAVWPAPGTAARAAAMAAMPAARPGMRAAARRSAATRRPPPAAAARRAGIERAVFERHPVRVPLPVGQERLVTLPAPAALHVPTDMARVARIEVIDRTMYVTALVPFTPIRIVAELIDSGQQVPMDLVAGADTATAVAELEVFVVDAGRESVNASVTATAAAADDPAQAGGERQPSAPGAGADMVSLTRHAARMLYAPRRLAWSEPGVQQVDVDTGPVDGLLRGAHVQAAPVGQWRSGQLYVTAVRITNLSRLPLEIPLEDVRGRWISATAQHGRIGPAGSETDTTALYLVCDRAFAACLH